MSKFLEYTQGDTIDCSNIDLSRQNILNITLLSTFLQANPQINHIKLSNCNLKFSHAPIVNPYDTRFGRMYGPPDIESIFYFNQNTTLDLSHNPLGNSILFFSMALPKCENFLNFTKLNLSYCEMTTYSLKLLMKYGLGFINIIELDLSHNKLTDQAVDLILNNFDHITSYKKIDLSNNQITFNGLKSLFEGLKNIANKLEVIKFENNLITEAEYRELCKLSTYSDAGNSDVANDDVAEAARNNKVVKPKPTEHMTSEDMDTITMFASYTNDDNAGEIKLMLEKSVTKFQANELISSFQHIQAHLPQGDQHHMDEFIKIVGDNTVD